MKRASLVLLVLLFALIACNRKELSITGSFGSARIAGEVFFPDDPDQGDRAGIGVRVRGTGMSTATGPDGRFVFLGVPDSDLELVFERSADRIHEQHTVRQGKTEGLVIPLRSSRARRRPIRPLDELKGVITAIKGNRLDVLLESGHPATVMIGPDTTVHRHHQQLTIAELQVGARVEIRARRNDDGTFAAISIEVEENELDIRVQLKGAITGISGSTLAVRLREGPTITVQIVLETIIKAEDGRSLTPSDLHVGNEIEVEARPNADGTFIAISIEVEDFEERIEIRVQLRGAITDISGSTLTLLIREGHTVTVKIVPETIIRADDERLLTPDDLHVGDLVRVEAHPNADLTFTAISIDVEKIEIRVRMRGGITGISGSTLTVQLQEGPTVIVKLVPETIIRAEDGRTLTPGDLRVGNKIEFEARPNADLTFTALSIEVQS